jgi:beta-galactosidase
LQWDLIEDGTAIQSGVFKDLDIAPETEGQIRLGYRMPRQKPGAEYHLDLRLVSPSARGVLPAEHIYAEAQFEIPNDIGAAKAKRSAGGSLRTDESERAITVAGGERRPTMTSAITCRTGRRSGSRRDAIGSSIRFG